MINFIKRKSQRSTSYSENSNRIKISDLALIISTIGLALLPAFLAFTFIQFDIIYTGALRPQVFENSWMIFALLIIATSIATGMPVLKEIAHLPRTYLVVFVLFACIWVYTSIFVAPSTGMAIYFSLIAVTALLLGLTMAALRRANTSFKTNIAWAIFLAMLLHAPFWVWLYMLEGDNPDYNWLYRLPGYPGLRMYGYSVEAGIAAGLGLFFLSGNQSKQRRIWLAIGVTLLWALLFWGGGRGAFYALIATIVLVSLFVPKFAKIMWLFSISTITLGAGLSFLLPKPSASYGIMSRLGKTFNSSSINEISGNRFTIWSDAYEIFLERPIFGHGVAQYRYLTAHPELAVHEQTHNILLESLVSFGAIGTIALIFLLGRIWLTALLRLRNTISASTVPMFLVATTLLTHGFFSGTFFHIHSMFMIALTMGLLLQNTNAEQKSS